MKAADFSYHLPPELIAQQPRRRGSSRLLLLPREHGDIRHLNVRDLPDLLAPGDCLVVNDSRVLPARLRAVKQPSGARIELLLHRELAPGVWEALARPCRRLAAGCRLDVGGHLLTVLGLDGHGRIRIGFPPRVPALQLMRRYGEPPLPPYIRRLPGQDGGKDRRRYQTIFAAAPGSVAAPTAGLHFSPALVRALRRRGVGITSVTLHVGWGTFAPLPDGDLPDDFSLHPEYFHISEDAARRLRQVRDRGGRLIACGTTVARALESAADSSGRVSAGGRETRLCIRPGYVWKAVDGLLTNFHLPGSSLLLLVAAFGRKERVLAAYAEAVRQHYHFYSYGDAMFLL